MRKIGIKSWHYQVPSKVTTRPELCCPCCVNRDWCVLTVIVIINLIPVTRVHTKRLFVDNCFRLLNPILLPSPLSICTLQIVQRHPRCHQFHYIIWFLHTVYLERFPLICPHIQKIKRSHLFPFKVLVNVIARYIISPILSLLDQQSSMHASSFQFNNPLCYKKKLSNTTSFTEPKIGLHILNISPTVLPSSWFCFAPLYTTLFRSPL